MQYNPVSCSSDMEKHAMEWKRWKGVSTTTEWLNKGTSFAEMLQSSHMPHVSCATSARERPDVVIMAATW